MLRQAGLLDNELIAGTPEVEVDPRELRQRIEKHLHDQGFVLSNGRLLASVLDDKERLRRLHREAVAHQRDRARESLRRDEDRFIGRLASASEVHPVRVTPALIPIVDRHSFLGRLWRWCALHWSIPVSSGYGRRLRFLVVDLANGDKIIGLIGLGDPVFALGCRDQWIGWSRNRRTTALTSVMDAFVLGAVPPYNFLLGGKLVALLATSSEVRDAFRMKYGHRQTLITQRDPDAQLALVTTTSALGRSSIYNRLTNPVGRLAYEPVGYTSGSGDFHFSGAIYDDLARFAAQISPDGATYRHKRWTGTSFRNRREVIQRALDALGYHRQLRMHGIRRQVFVAPLMGNTLALLRGEATEPAWSTLSVDELSGWWRKRWAVPRSTRNTEGQEFDPCSWRLWAER